jgi:uncharacterized membrane protein YphA (DoxX/SURF4 family)
MPGMSLNLIQDQTGMRRTIIVDIISFLFILLFVYAAISKVLEFDEFKLQLQRSPILTTVADLAAYVVPAAEIVISLMLMIPLLRFMGLLAGYLLMVSFTTYIVLVLKFSFYVPCSCGGVLESLGWSEHLVFNMSFVILGAAGVMLHDQVPSLEWKTP